MKRSILTLLVLLAGCVQDADGDGKVEQTAAPAPVQANALVPFAREPIRQLAELETHATATGCDLVRDWDERDPETYGEPVISGIFTREVSAEEQGSSWAYWCRLAGVTPEYSLRAWFNDRTETRDACPEEIWRSDSLSGLTYVRNVSRAHRDFDRVDRSTNDAETEGPDALQLPALMIKEEGAGSWFVCLYGHWWVQHFD